MLPNGSFGDYLRDRRTRLDPAAFGCAGGRRRTPGLRREEVAQRARISSTWYSWLEQGRGGPPSAQVLDRLAEALTLTDVEREHLFLLALGRPPEVRYQPPADVPARLQRTLDVLEACPAIIRTATWDVVAWNRTAAAVLTDYGALPPTERNILRQLFLDPAAKASDRDWENVARFLVGAFRADAARAGAMATVRPLVDELSARSPDFAGMWRDSEIHTSCEGVKRISHPEHGEIALEISAFAVDGRPDLAMLLYTPVTADDAARITALSAGFIAGRR